MNRNSVFALVATGIMVLLAAFGWVVVEQLNAGPSEETRDEVVRCPDFSTAPLVELTDASSLTETAQWYRGLSEVENLDVELESALTVLATYFEGLSNAIEGSGPLEVTEEAAEQATKTVNDFIENCN